MTEPQLSGRRARSLAALCDTYIPAVAPPTVEADDGTGFWGRRATDLGVDGAVAEYVLTALDPADRDGLLQLLDLLGAAGITRLPAASRERLVRGLRRLSADVATGLDALRSLTMLEFYGRSAQGERNPNWEQLGYPGPPDLEPPSERLAVHVPAPGRDTVVLEADVCVVGSGSGGGVIAGELARGGLDVVVLEAGGHLEGTDFPIDETTALRTMYWRGMTSTVEGNVAIMAGATLGGGSTVNWMNCVPPPAAVREAWERDHGLSGLRGSEFDGHLDAVLERISATTEASDLNGPNDRLRSGAQALGWAWHATTRNADLDRYDPVSAGHVGFGDRSGSKQGTLATYLRDAVDAGARVLPGCRADRVLTQAGRARGVEATLTDATGTRQVRVDARHVVVAAGALETPALLLRSGIGGPAVGQHLRLHPVPNMAGYYPRATRSWWGAPQTVIVDEARAAYDGHGYLVETPHLHPGVGAAALPWISGRDHKLLVGRSSELASFIAVTRDRGAGRVTIDEAGEAVVAYPLEDDLDLRVLREAVGDLVRLHVAAGAHTIVDLHPARPFWRRGDDVEAFIADLDRMAFGRGGRPLFSAHQMGSARMGSDPATSVADPTGQLHDTPGVWVGDTSAFPTAVGSNPMVTCMALARRTAHALLAD